MLTRKQYQKAHRFSGQYARTDSNSSVEKNLQQDPDLKDMSSVELRREVMKLRRAFRKELSDTGNRRCWITLLQALPEGKILEALSLPKKEFLANCESYYNRNQ